jgi:hypothetical protein
VGSEDSITPIRVGFEVSRFRVDHEFGRGGSRPGIELVAIMVTTVRMRIPIGVEGLLVMDTMVLIYVEAFERWRELGTTTTTAGGVVGIKVIISTHESWSMGRTREYM